ncbi:tyrosine-type recombinase/integrase [Seonamhaeicola marinus]|nr:tyrosine-type recombinase/integrase [Seonamhaeicola marinus]
MKAIGSTYIDFEKANYKGQHLIKSGENPNFGLLIICGCNFGLRIGDLLKLNWNDLKGDEFDIIEKKTGKKRTIQINDNVKQAITYFKDSLIYEKEGFPFVSQKGTIYSIQQVNRLIKKEFGVKRKSSHSLRKSFGRRVWDTNGRTDQALLYLSEIFNHSNTNVTRRYLGIREEEIRDIYMRL